MKLSVVVPAFNEERGLGASLQSIRAGIRAFERAGWTTEIIVCDNNSTDGTAEVARRAGATVVFEPVNQISRARNAGAHAASGDWLLFIDADSHPSVELCDDARLAIESGRCIAGGSTVRFDDAPRGVRIVGRMWNAVSRTMRWVAGSFVFCETSAFRNIGGFSESLYAGEEIDLSRRLKRVARQRGQRVVVLFRHPLLTSARKAWLYTPREMRRFVWRTVVRRGRTLRSPEECFSWYDGRR